MNSQPQFHSLDVQHVITLGILILLGCVIVWASRRMAPENRLWIGRVLAVLLFGYAVVTYIQKGLAHELSLDYALPLELCHWVLIACLLTLLHPNQTASEIAYFWGFAGTLQATLTPDISLGFPSWEYIEFFWSHGTILLAIVFIISRQGFRPRKGSPQRMLLTINVYAAVVGVIDWRFHWNYGYLCRKPMGSSLLDYLGPWPWYILSVEGIAFASFFLLHLPWKILDRQKPPRISRS
ncbi:MAG TPA: TIGR02206 family membrane protein [Acidobacteriota bacterium]|nr:TIGR02206 family membrane protein [Acidobacteriota bacterium]